MVATEASDMTAPIRRALAAHPNVTQVVACGGDGTVAACATALDGRDIPIAIVPTGTTNVLAFELGLPSHAVRAAALLRGPMRRTPFRTWSVNERQMLLQLGVGFDGLLMWRTPRRLKRALGFLGVVASALRQGVGFDFPMMRVTGELADGTPRTVMATSVMVANAKRWAGRQLFVPTADPADDLVDVVLLTYRNFPQLAAFWLAILLPRAPHLSLGFVEHVPMRRLRIESLGREVEAHLDGEPIMLTPLDLRCAGRVELLAPM
jgi:diacylglycerol kinase (ATP)